MTLIRAKFHTPLVHGEVPQINGDPSAFTIFGGWVALPPLTDWREASRGELSPDPPGLISPATEAGSTSHKSPDPPGILFQNEMLVNFEGASSQLLEGVDTLHWFVVFRESTKGFQTKIHTQIQMTVCTRVLRPGEEATLPARVLQEHHRAGRGHALVWQTYGELLELDYLKSDWWTCIPEFSCPVRAACGSA